MEPGFEIEEQPESPLLIAVKGHSSSSKSKIVHSLAQFHKFPVFDEEDIISALQDSLETEHCDDLLPLEILSQISSTQLCLKLSVIISARLSHRAHFDRLVDLASFTGSRLVFVECSNQNDRDLDYYDVGNVPRLDIDTTKPFHAEDFISGMLKAAVLI
ncbi:hypothetical protein SADUNF_Sadunf01G0033500 [Salix dunnii]|uniref:Uncharacterized protein n=1 Tax=Salix dunnii TaxID=1413687 RepID=A0A835TIZ4_9ROSI|nr:hypothetical protein SADUNF_Sadunf01G0033500 [Salix dunnii]